jgi:hypothetical protein
VEPRGNKCLIRYIQHYRLMRIHRRSLSSAYAENVVVELEAFKEAAVQVVGEGKSRNRHATGMWKRRSSIRTN